MISPLMKDTAHHLFSLQGLVVKDEGNAAPHHLQSASTVKHRATLTHNGHWKTKNKRTLQVETITNTNTRPLSQVTEVFFRYKLFRSITVGKI